MNRSEARSFASVLGKLIMYKHFIEMRVCYIQLKQLDDGEEGSFPHHEFWTIRSGGLWEKGCEEYKHLMI